MQRGSIDLQSSHGTNRCLTFAPEGEGPWPAVVYYCDAGGQRPAASAMAERLAAGGYVVAVPDLFHGDPDQQPFEMGTVFSVPAERSRLMARIGRVRSADVAADSAALLDELARRPEVRPGPAGVVGYCMGGRLAMIVAGTLGERIGAAASIHGGGLVSDAPDSPHRLADRIRARLYLGVADQDPSCTPEHQKALEAALTAAGVRYQMELNPGARHGYAVPDMPVFDAAAAERQYQRVLALFGASL